MRSTEHPDDVLERTLRNEVIRKEIRKLPRKQQQVVKLRIIENKTLQEVGNIIHLSRERVRNIEKQVIKSLKHRLMLKNIC